MKWQQIHINQQLNLKITKNKKNKINKQVEEKQNHRYREHFDGCQMGDRLGAWAKKKK